MKPPTHRWDLTPKEAIDVQRQLRDLVRLEPFAADLTTIAGVDLSYEVGGTELWAVIVVLDFATLEVIGRSGVKDTMRFPYIPGLLSFREIPALMTAWAALPLQPDVVMVDGHGIAHPRRVGIATHLGLLTDTPSIGCGKTRFIGDHDTPAETKGSHTPLVHDGEDIGCVLRTRDRVKPVYISPGHRITIPDALRIALAATGKTRIPEPTRHAHLAANALRRGEWPTGVAGFG